MKTWDQFVRRLVPHLPGCPEFEIADRLRDAATDFLERTRAWRQERVVLATTAAGEPDYRLTPPENAALTHIHVAWVGDVEVLAALPGKADDDHPTKTADKYDYQIEIVDGSGVRLTPAPEQGGEIITATVSWVTTDDSDGIEDELYRLYHEAIEKGALAELMAQVQKPWSSANASAHRDRFEMLIAETANKIGPVRRNPLRVRMWG